MTEFSIPANPVFFLELGVHLQSVPLLPTKTTVCEVQSFPSVIILRMNAWHVIFSAYLFLLPLPQAQSLSEPCFTPQNKSFGQMVAGTGGERCQKRSCVPGQWGAHTAPLRDWGWHTSPPLGTKNTPSGDNPGPGEGLLCLNYLAVPLRPASESQNLTKMYSKAKTPMKMFSVFSSCMTHMASAMKTVPSVSKQALNGKLLVGCFILSWLPGLHYLLHRVYSYLMGDDSSLLLMIFYKTFPEKQRCLLKCDFMALFCGLENQVRTGWLMSLWWSSWQWVTCSLKILIKTSNAFFLH